MHVHSCFTYRIDRIIASDNDISEEVTAIDSQGVNKDCNIGTFTRIDYS